MPVEFPIGVVSIQMHTTGHFCTLGWLSGATAPPLLLVAIMFANLLERSEVRASSSPQVIEGRGESLYTRLASVCARPFGAL